jgi:hypothetical protein
VVADLRAGRTEKPADFPILRGQGTRKAHVETKTNSAAPAIIYLSFT